MNNLNHGADKDDNDKDSKNGEAFEKVNTVERQNSNPHLFYKVVSYHRQVLKVLTALKVYI